MRPQTKRQVKVLATKFRVTPLDFTLSVLSLFYEVGNGSKGTTNRKSVRLPKTNDVFCSVRRLELLVRHVAARMV
nr:MAG TPA: hypothetical protein [Caudoviricetes sp.]